MSEADEDDDDDAKPIFINCGKHGRHVAAVVCGHMAKPTWFKVGFVENSDHPNDLQAWCDKCERMYLAEGDRTERFNASNAMVMVCTPCYAALKKRHSR
jgi:hypothetical protein